MKQEFTLAKQWNKVYDNFKGNRLSVWRENASPFFSSKIDYLKHLGFRRVLDAGCGDGRNLMAFAKAGFDVTGVDLSQSALNRCRKNCKGLNTIRLEKQNLENLAFKPNSFDAIICDFVMAHVEKPQKIMQNFYRLLRKGGYLLIEFTSTKDPHCGKGKKIGKNQYLQKGIYLRFYTIRQIEKLLRQFGIAFMDAAWSIDPAHGPGYNRKARHKHHSYFIIAKKY